MSGGVFDEALERIGRAELVAYPTETLFGLGADATRDDAVARLRRWKGRREDQPLSLLVEDAAGLGTLGIRLSPAALRLAGAFWPGPLTLVLPCQRPLAGGVARASDGAVGVRCSSHPVAAELARRLAKAGLGPLTATSLNRSGGPAAATREAARALCAGGGPWLLDVPGAPPPEGTRSSVVDATGERPRVLREGAVPRRDIERCLAGAGRP